MKALELTSEMMFKLGGDPATYASAPFLEPMKIAALTKAAQYKGGCPTCQKGAQMRDAQLVGAAMARLLYGTYQENRGALKAFKSTALKILNNQAEELIVRFKINGVPQHIQF